MDIRLKPFGYIVRVIMIHISDMEDLELMPLKDVHKMLCVSTVTFRGNYVKDGKLSAVRFSPRKVFVPKEEIGRFIQESEK